jgi:sulfur carrier protein
LGSRRSTIELHPLWHYVEDYTHYNIGMNIVLNGQTKTLPGPICVSALIDELGYTGKRIAVERNGEIVPKSTYAGVMLEAGDRLEIVVAVGGG